MSRPRQTTQSKRGAGKHHRIDIKLRDSVPEGTLDFYSDSFTMHLSLKKHGISGSSIVSGRGHSAKLKLSSHNRWTLEYAHTKDDRTMKVFTRFGKVTKATSLFGVSHKGSMHDIKLSFSERMGLHGHVIAKTKQLAYGVRFTKEGMTRADITHTGQSHKVQLKLHANGEYEFKVNVKVGGGSVSIWKDRKQVVAEASFTF